MLPRGGQGSAWLWLSWQTARPAIDGPTGGSARMDLNKRVTVDENPRLKKHCRRPSKVVAFEGVVEGGWRSGVEGGRGDGVDS